MGNTFPMSASQCGRLERGMKIPEMNDSGRKTASTTGWAASALPMKAARANPRQQNTTAPTTTSSTKAGAVLAGRCALTETHPMATRTPAMTRAVTQPTRERPPMMAPVGTGVARRRL